MLNFRQYLVLGGHDNWRNKIIQFFVDYKHYTKTGTYIRPAKNNKVSYIYLFRSYRTLS